VSLTTVAFFNNKGGVGKTTLVYHLAWMYSELGVRVIAADLDPQANLTRAMLTDDRIEELLEGAKIAARGRTVREALDRLIEREGDILDPHIEKVTAGLGAHRSDIGLICGDLRLHDFEDMLSSAWSECLDDRANNARFGFRVISAFYRLILRAANEHRAELALIDVGPNLGPINRAALVAADYVVIPLSPDLFSVQGLRNVGPTLRDWSEGWRHRSDHGARLGVTTGDFPSGTMRPLGYVLLQALAINAGRAPIAQQRYVDRIPKVYREAVLNKPPQARPPAIDPNRLGVIKHYHSLIQLAQEARAPMFLLRPADGAIGAYSKNVVDAKQTFKALALKIAAAAGVSLDLE
jgi:cellulose biosynthesis protein BcsQ